MIPLATTQRVMTWFCVCPPEEIVPEWKDIAYKFAYKVITFILAASLLSNFLASFIFFWRFVFHDLEKAFYIVWQAPSSFSTFYVLIIAIATRHKINAIFKTLAKIYRASKYFFSNFWFFPHFFYESYGILYKPFGILYKKESYFFLFFIRNA